MNEKMIKKHNTGIFKTFSTGLSNQSHYSEKQSYVISLECSPEDGIQMIIENEIARGFNGHEFILKKWLTKTDVICLRRILRCAENFYSEFEDSGKN